MAIGIIILAATLALIIAAALKTVRRSDDWNENEWGDEEWK